MCSIQLASEKDPLSDMHWLPCTVSHAGPAPVSNYFMPHTTGPSLPSPNHLHRRTADSQRRSQAPAPGSLHLSRLNWFIVADAYREDY